MDASEEQSFQERDSSLADFFDMDHEAMAEDEWSNAFPIYTDLSHSHEHYSKPELIAEGGMKHIYRVWDTRSERPVAKAVLKDSSNTIAQERFLREARIAASLQHPNILSIHDIGLDEKGAPYFIMELLQGDTLGVVLKKLSDNDPAYVAQYSREALLEHFVKICDAVSFAHSKNIVHLDLKPDNIFLNDYGQVHLCDWGLSRYLDSDDDQFASFLQNDYEGQMTLCGKLRGTPGFMSPEQCTPNGEISVASDIYALGSILYSILSFEAIVEGETIDSIIENVCSGNIIPLSAHDTRGKIPASLNAVVMKAVALDPSDRYQTVHELRDELMKYLHGYATEAENASFLTQISLLIQRNQRSVAIICVAVVAICCIVSTFIIQLNNERQKAVDAGLESDRQRDLAEENLKRFKDQQKLTESERMKTGELLVKNTFSRDVDETKKTLHLIEDALKRSLASEKRTALLERKAKLHFLLQEFDLAIQSRAESTGDRRLTNLYELSEKYKTANRVDGAMSDKDFAELLSHMSRQSRAYMEAFYCIHMAMSAKRDRTPEEYAPIASIMLALLNNKWGIRLVPIKLVKKANGYHLNLSHKQFRVFCIGDHRDINVLAPLQLVSIDVSFSPFFEFQQLFGLSLKSLTFEGCLTNTINEERLNTLKRVVNNTLIFNTKDIPPAQVEMLKKEFTIIDRKE